MTGRKSMHIDEIREYGFLIKEGFNPRVPYLEIVDEIIKKG
jgi:recombination protein U